MPNRSTRSAAIVVHPHGKFVARHNLTASDLVMARLVYKPGSIISIQGYVRLITNRHVRRNNSLQV